MSGLSHDGFRLGRWLPLGHFRMGAGREATNAPKVKRDIKIRLSVPVWI